MKLEYELERIGMIPERIALLSESETKALYEWAMGVLEKLLHLDPEKKCEIANEAMKRVWMPPNSGPGGAERFIRECEQAYLMELRAGLVAATELALSSRLYAYKDKLPPEVLKYLMSLPAYERPKSLEDMHEALRKWADIERAGQPYGRKQHR